MGTGFYLVQKKVVQSLWRKNTVRPNQVVSQRCGERGSVLKSPEGAVEAGGAFRANAQDRLLRPR